MRVGPNVGSAVSSIAGPAAAHRTAWRKVEFGCSTLAGKQAVQLLDELDRRELAGAGPKTKGSAGQQEHLRFLGQASIHFPARKFDLVLGSRRIVLRRPQRDNTFTMMIE